MNRGTLTRNEAGTWMVKWSDLHSFGHGPHWMYTKLSEDSNSIKYIENNELKCKPLEEDLRVDFEIGISGYDKESFAPINYARLVFPEVEKFEKQLLLSMNKQEPSTQEQLDIIDQQLDVACKYGLEVEVIYWALEAMRKDPQLTPAEAFVTGILEWVK